MQLFLIYFAFIIKLGHAKLFRGNTEKLVNVSHCGAKNGILVICGILLSKRLNRRVPTFLKHDLKHGTKGTIATIRRLRFATF